MVRGHQDDGSAQIPALLERLQHTRQLAIDRRDLAVIGGAAETLGQVRRRLVRRVRIVVVDPHEPRARLSVVARRREPAERGVGGRAGVALDIRRAPPVVAAGQVVFVDVEAAIEPEATVERERRHEGRRAVAGLLEILGRRAECRRQDVAPIVAEPMSGRRAARENRRVGRPRQRDMRQGGRELNASLRQGVQIRRQRVGRAVAAEMVGAQRVYRHEQDIRVLLGNRSGPRGRLPAATSASTMKKAQMRRIDPNSQEYRSTVMDSRTPFCSQRFSAARSCRQAEGLRYGSQESN